MRERVIDELQRIERQYGVRVLLAVESGSRAWGFASPDSDYDVRFIYNHHRDWYISVAESRDVIEEMLPGDLDVSGWDLRKTLRLFGKCNIALNEWLGSPIVYWQAPTFREQLLQLMPSYFNPVAGLHHYRSMAVRTLEENLQGERIGIKKLFYVLRPLLACRWIERKRSPPPTLFHAMMDDELVAPEERIWIEALLKRKADALEAEPVAVNDARVDRIRAELERYGSMSISPAVPPSGSKDELDGLLRCWVVTHDAPPCPQPGN
jgi:predicted nucleotidyltransferase